ncbi:MAG TPA: hypothetical protein DCL18_02620 [Prevotella sp.]|nr:hypothetical protein [Prevotella sp.]
MWRPTGTSNQPPAITSHPKDTPTASKVISTLPEANVANPKLISMNPKVIMMNPKVIMMNPKVTPIATATIAVGAKMMRKVANTVKYS